jgi:hypothetical protein
MAPKAPAVEKPAVGGVDCEAIAIKAYYSHHARESALNVWPAAEQVYVPAETGSGNTSSTVASRNAVSEDKLGRDHLLHYLSKAKVLRDDGDLIAVQLELAGLVKYATQLLSSCNIMSNSEERA